MSFGKKINSLLASTLLIATSAFVITGCKDSNEVNLALTGLDVVATKTESFEMRFMEFGMYSENSKNTDFTKGSITGVPLTDVPDLLRRYPEVELYRGEGSDIARKEAITVFLYSNSLTVRESMGEIVKRTNDNFKTQGARVCVHIVGSLLDADNVKTKNGDPVEMNDINRMAYVDYIATVPCF